MSNELEYDDNKPGEQVSDGEEFRPKYRFNDEDGAHQHLLWSERNQDWEQLTGVTTIIDVLGKVLTWWASGKAVETLGWTNSKIKVDGKYQTIPLEQRIAHLKPYYNQIMQDTEETYLARLDTAYKAHSVFLDKSADVGTDMHAELEKYVNMCLENNGLPISSLKLISVDKRVLDFADWAVSNVAHFIWSEAYCYDEIEFTGGISDVGLELKNGEYAVLDFKSAKDVYFSMWTQIGGYDFMISKNGLYDKNGEKLLTLEKPITKYFVIPFGASKFIVEERSDVKMYIDSFLNCVKLYRNRARDEKIASL